jgi:hypothetical protein
MTVVESVNGKTGVVNLPGLTSEGQLPSSMVSGSTTGPISGTSSTGFSLRDFPSAKDPAFGAAGNGVADDTEALQKFITYLAENHRYGTLPAGTYKISAPLKFPCTDSWGLIGAGMWATIISQATSNTPILELGTGTVENMHSTRLEAFQLTYAAKQPSTNTKAHPIVYVALNYESVLNQIWFQRGSYAIKVEEGIGGPWGQSWDNLIFGSELTGGAMDWTAVENAVPNNHWGRFFVEATNMVGPIFKEVKGYAWVIDTIEIIKANQGAQLMTCRNGSQVSIGALKLEIGEYGAAFSGLALLNFNGSNVKIDQFFVGGSTTGDEVVVNMVGDVMYAIQNSTQFLGGKPSKTVIGMMNCTFTITAGAVYLLRGGGAYSTTQWDIGTVYSSGCELVNNDRRIRRAVLGIENASSGGP